MSHKLYLIADDGTSASASLGEVSDVAGLALRAAAANREVVDVSATIRDVPPRELREAADALDEPQLLEVGSATLRLSFKREVRPSKAERE